MKNLKKRCQFDCIYKKVEEENFQKETLKMSMQENIAYTKEKLHQKQTQIYKKPQHLTYKQQQKKFSNKQKKYAAYLINILTEVQMKNGNQNKGHQISQQLEKLKNEGEQQILDKHSQYSYRHQQYEQIQDELSNTCQYYNFKIKQQFLL